MKETNQTRSELLLGKDKLQKLKNSTVVVVGVGGVGGFCVEALARCGVGRLVLIDHDIIEASNMNRQIIATQETLQQVKVEVFKKRIHAIDPGCQVDAYQKFYTRDMNEILDSYKIDFLIDCIDSIKSKQDLISYCLEKDVPFLSSMGMGRRQDPTKLRIMELEKTSYDPIAKRLRNWKRKNHIRKKIMVISSLEPPISVPSNQPLPSTIFVPASAGLLMANECIQRL